MSTSRRKFIKISALGLGGVATAASTFNSIGVNSYLEDFALENTLKKLNQTATYCEVCFWKCAAWVHSDDKGAIHKIIGNDIDPHCNGRLCPRGNRWRRNVY